jgi:hypothetical protein
MTLYQFTAFFKSTGTKCQRILKWKAHSRRPLVQTLLKGARCIQKFQPCPVIVTSQVHLGPCPHIHRTSVDTPQAFRSPRACAICSPRWTFSVRLTQHVIDKWSRLTGECSASTAATQTEKVNNFNLKSTQTGGTHINNMKIEYPKIWWLIN